MSQSDARAKLIAKIKACLNTNGRTEAEVLAFLAVARRMMEEHDITEDDLDFGGEQVTAEKAFKPDWDRIRDNLSTSVGRFCHCAAWGTRGRSAEITFCGLESEVIFAHWLLDQLGDFVVREADNFKRTRPNNRLTRIERESFIVGCTGRIADRLAALTPRPKSSGRDLVLARNALIEQYMHDHDIKLREPFKLYRADAEAHRAGENAGDRAQFNRPVETGEGQRLLGNGR